MKKSKWFAPALAALLFVSLTSYAQFGSPGGGPPSGEQRRPEPRDPEKVMEEEVHWMKKKLKLNNDQTATVTRISAKYAYAQDDLMRNAMGAGRPSREEMERTRDRMKQLGLEKDVEMRKVLNDSQYKKYLKRKEDLSKEMENNRSGGRPGGAMGGRPGGGGPGNF